MLVGVDIGGTGSLCRAQYKAQLDCEAINVRVGWLAVREWPHIRDEAYGRPTACWCKAICVHQSTAQQLTSLRMNALMVANSSTCAQAAGRMVYLPTTAGTIKVSA